MVAAGMTIEQVLDMGAWSTTDVAAVLRTHGLAVAEGGAIVRAALSGEQLLELGLAAPDPMVRRQAARAQALLVDVARALAVRTARESAEESKRRRRDALRSWMSWLQSALAEAQTEFDRLAPPRKPNRSTRSPE